MSAHRFRLPGILDTIADAADLEAALKIAHEKGGVRVHFPAPAQLGENHWLVNLVGVRAARSICVRLSAGHIGAEHVVPLGPASYQAKSWRTMHELDGSGLSKQAIARITGRHYKTVQRVLNGKRKTVAAVMAQDDLFDAHKQS